MIKKHFRQSKQAGFSLIELVVSIAVFVILAVGVSLLIANLFSNANKQSQLISDSDQARKLAFQIVNELRGSTTSSTGAWALATANNQDITFYTNLDGGPAVERIRYFVQNGSLWKGVLIPTGSPYVYNSAQEQTWEVLKNLANANNPIFYYYDGNYNGTSNNYLTAPINLNNVKFIKVNLMVYNKGGNVGTNIYTVTDGATIRNLKTNLGN